MMINNNTILKIENLSKQYRLGVVGTGTISHDLNRWWHRVRGKEDPFLKIGETNDRATKGDSKYVWALKDINFEVQEGEVLGIIGKNGAGKSTLLKILSQVTGPTTGSIKSRGRIASLLEVGTGFHPELTGKENIFLNGAILGMTKAEIKAKLDEIVDFSGVARYLDTPVKRYSSGMKVRLAFAVAAHLEPDILVIDEVLAVGDAEFQKKAIGKMQDISKGQGRTVLFVSHDMAAVENLCSKAVLLENGKISRSGGVKEIIDSYVSNKKGLNPEISFKTKYGNVRVSLLNSKNFHSLDFVIGSTIFVKFSFDFKEIVNFANIGIGINTIRGSRIVTYHTYYELNKKFSLNNKTEILCTIESLNLMQGSYNIEISLFENSTTTFYNNPNLFTINIANTDYYSTGRLPNPKYQGLIVQNSKWEINEV